MKQKTFKAAAERYEKYSERFDNDESAIGNPETWGKRVLTEEDIFNQRDIDAVTDYIGKETSKQETLEEVAENYVNSFEFGIAHPRRVCKNAFINGAKWQQERSYSEEQMLEMVNKFVFDYTYNYRGNKTLYEYIDVWYKEFKRLEEKHKNK